MGRQAGCVRLRLLINGFAASGALHVGTDPFWLLFAELIMQILRDIAGCGINCTSHIEGWHRALKVHSIQPLPQKICSEALPEDGILIDVIVIVLHCSKFDLDCAGLLFERAAATN